jgi:hypothetical protein
MLKWIYILSAFIVFILVGVGLFSLTISNTNIFNIFIVNFFSTSLEIFDVAFLLSIIGLGISFILNKVTEGKRKRLGDMFEFCIASTIVFGVMRIFLNAMVDVANL